MTYCHLLCAMSIDPPILRYSYFKIWPWKSMVKVMCEVQGQGHVWPSKFKGHGYGQVQIHWSHLRPGVQSICLLFVLWQSDHFWLRYRKFHIWPWKFKVKVMAKVKSDGHILGLGVQSICLLLVSWQSDHFWLRYTIFDLEIQGQGHGQGQTRWSHLSPRVQSICLLFVLWQSDHFWLRYRKFHIWPWKFKVKVMAKVKSDGHISGLGVQSICLLLVSGNRTIFGWDIANSTFDLVNSRSRSWPRSNPMVTSEPYVQSICLLFVSWQSDHFWLRYRKFYIWPWKFKVNVMARSNPMAEFNRYVCFLFRGNRTIFGWDIANSIFDLKKSRSRSRRKCTKI